MLITRPAWSAARRRHKFRRRLEYFHHEPLAPLTLTLEVRPVDGGSGFDPYPDSLKSREKFLAFCGSEDSDGA